MLQSGFSRQLFDRWAEDPRNGVVLAGYSVEGTMARRLESNPSEVETLAHRKISRRCGVERVSFSAHADSLQTSAFVDALRPQVRSTGGVGRAAAQPCTLTPPPPPPPHTHTHTLTSPAPCSVHRARAWREDGDAQAFGRPQQAPRGHRRAGLHAPQRLHRVAQLRRDAHCQGDGLLGSPRRRRPHHQRSACAGECV